ncbi:hypothetical protein GCM10010286_36130 [Streptomyces toxytricini]|nr:hypothetical protein GCM10010286_36130 [Streptomyces toxytricini]
MAGALLRRHLRGGPAAGPRRDRRLRRPLGLLRQARLPALDVGHPPGAFRLRLRAAVPVSVVAAVPAPFWPLVHAA